MLRFLFLSWVLLATRAWALDWTPAKNGDFVLCSAVQNGAFWVGTEDFGLWRREKSGAWTQFLPADGLPDTTVSALAARGDELWVGTPRGGLGVFDGRKWKTIRLSEGGETRINDIAVSPEGAAWLATDDGIIGYDGARWVVPQNPRLRVQMMAVALRGQEIWLASACNGVLQTNATLGAVSGPKIPVMMPLSPLGEGVPSARCNDICVDENEQIWVATDCGFARSSDGKTWFFVRGADWRENVEGLRGGFGGRDVAAGVELLGEDWVTTLCPTGTGKIWLGLRQKGVELRDIETGDLIYSSRTDSQNPAPGADTFVRCVFPVNDSPTGGERALVGLYGGGLVPVLGAQFPVFQPPFAANARAWAPVGETEKPGEKLPRRVFEGAAKGAFGGMDFQTRGDWVGHYGAQLTRCFYVESNDKTESGYGLRFTTGPHRANKNEDDMYFYIQWLATDNPNVLQMPSKNTRRQGEVNDGTWQSARYPRSFEGPGLVGSVRVPEGTHRIALYWFNKDGQSGANRFRDHIVRLREGGFETLEELEDVLAQPELARLRLHDGWNGQYGTFTVQGPGNFTIEIERNRSNVTILSGIFVDKIEK